MDSSNDPSASVLYLDIPHTSRVITKSPMKNPPPHWLFPRTPRPATDCIMRGDLEFWTLESSASQPWRALWNVAIGYRPMTDEGLLHIMQPIAVVADAIF